MLTDGIISDMDQTKEAIVTVSLFPCVLNLLLDSKIVFIELVFHLGT